MLRMRLGFRHACFRDAREGERRERRRRELILNVVVMGIREKKTRLGGIEHSKKLVLRATTSRISACVCDETHDEYPDGDVHYAVNGRYAVTRRDPHQGSECRRECNGARTDPEWVCTKPTRRRNGERENRSVIKEPPHVARPPGVEAAMVYDRRDADT